METAIVIPPFQVNASPNTGALALGFGVALVELLLSALLPEGGLSLVEPPLAQPANTTTEAKDSAKTFNILRG